MKSWGWLLAIVFVNAAASSALSSPSINASLEKCSYASSHDQWRHLYDPFEKPECADFWIRIVRAMHDGPVSISRLNVKTEVREEITSPDYATIAALLRMPYWLDDQIKNIAPQKILNPLAREITKHELLERARATEHRTLTRQEAAEIRKGEPLIEAQVYDFLLRSWMTSVLLTSPFSSADKAYMNAPRFPQESFFSIPGWRRDLIVHFLNQNQILKDREISHLRGYPTLRYFLWKELGHNALTPEEQHWINERDLVQSVRFVARYEEFYDPLKLWLTVLPRLVESGHLRNFERRLPAFVKNFAGLTDEEVSPHAAEFWHTYENPFAQFMRDAGDRDYSIRKKIRFAPVEDGSAALMIGLTLTPLKLLLAAKWIPAFLNAEYLLGTLGGFGLWDLHQVEKRLLIPVNEANRSALEQLYIHMEEGKTPLVSIHRVAAWSGDEPLSTSEIIFPASIFTQ